MDILLSRLAKTNYILAYIKKDTSEIRRQEKFYSQTVLKSVKPLSLEMANYYNDLGMVANTVFKDPIKSLELVSKGTAILEQLNTPLARTNLGISCRLLGDAFNNPKSPAYNVQQAKFYYKKAANALLRPEYQLKGDGDFSDLVEETADRYRGRWYLKEVQDFLEGQPNADRAKLYAVKQALG